MDPPQVVATVCGFLAVVALTIAACFAQKTRGKIWRHGKHNIYWDRPRNKGSGARDVEDWVRRHWMDWRDRWIGLIRMGRYILGGWLKSDQDGWMSRILMEASTSSLTLASSNRYQTYKVMSKSVSYENFISVAYLNNFLRNYD